MGDLRRPSVVPAVMLLIGACNQNPIDGMRRQANFGGTYVSNNRIGLMPTRIEFNGPRNCILYTNGVADSLTPGSPQFLGPGSSAEGLCQPAEGGMEFSSGAGLGGQTMYFRTVDADTFSYQRGGQTVYLTRRPAETATVPGAPVQPAGPPPEEPLATLGLTPSNPDPNQVTVTTNPVTVGTENRTVQVPVVRMENRAVQVPAATMGNQSSGSTR